LAIALLQQYSAEARPATTLRRRATWPRGRPVLAQAREVLRASADKDGIVRAARLVMGADAMHLLLRLAVRALLVLAVLLAIDACGDEPASTPRPSAPSPPRAAAPVAAAVAQATGQAHAKSGTSPASWSTRRPRR
jgi:hypothetical protein